MMSNDISVLNQDAALPAHLRKYQDKAAESAASMVTGFSSAPKVSIRGKQFRFDRDGTEVALQQGTPLDVVIIAIDPPEGMAKAFYKGRFKPDSAEAPDCFSTDGRSPDPLVAKPVCRSCLECPNNVFGSGKDESGELTKGKACSDHKNLFLVESKDISGDVYVLRVPATSLKNLSTYGRRLAGYKVPPQVVETSIKFTDETHPQLVFEALKFLDEKEADFSMQRSESDAVRLLLPSKNVLNVKRDALPAPEPQVELPPPPPVEKKLVLIGKFAKYKLQDFYDKKWTDEDLVDECYAEWQEITE